MNALDAMHQLILDQIQKNVEEKTTLVYLKWESSFSERVINEHSCPKNGVKNLWGKVKDQRPTSYPGFTGRVWVGLLNTWKGDSDSIFYSSCLHSGTGGYGTYSISEPTLDWNNPEGAYTLKEQLIYPVSYSCRIFVDDFPDVVSYIDAIKVDAKLYEEAMPAIKSNFLYLHKEFQ